MESFITPTAVIKQINLLEESLGVSLFERTHRGLILTEAGKSVYQDTKYIIQYCKDSVTRVKNAVKTENELIRIGTSPMTPASVLLELWPKVHERCPGMKFQLIPFDNTPENAREILGNLGQNLLLIQPNWSHYVDELRDDLLQNHRQIRIHSFDFYNMEIEIPYGLLHSPKPSDTVKKFLAAIQDTVSLHAPAGGPVLP